MTKQGTSLRFSLKNGTRQLTYGLQDYKCGEDHFMSKIHSGITFLYLC